MTLAKKLIRIDRTLIQNFQPDFDFVFSIAIMIAINNLIRTNQTLIENFQPDFDFVFSITP